MHADTCLNAWLSSAEPPHLLDVVPGVGPHGVDQVREGHAVPYEEPASRHRAGDDVCIVTQSKHIHACTTAGEQHI